MRAIVSVIVVIATSAVSLGQTGPLDPAEQIAALSQELESLLSPTGLAREPDAQYQRALGEVARRSGQMAERTADHQKQLEARLIQARAYNALAQDAIRQDKSSVVRLRVIQMRSAAEEARKIDTPEAQLTGNTWLLMADLIEGNRNARTLRERQASAMAQLGRFLTLCEESEIADDSPAILEVKLALLHLYDQAGENSRAMDLMRQLLQQIDPEDERAADFPDITASSKLVGQPFDAALRKEANHNAWQLWMIDEVDANSEEENILGDLERAVEARSELQLIVEPIRLTEAGEAASLPQGLGRSLPRFVLVDAQGVIRAVGHTSAVLDRLDEIRPPVVEATDVIDVQDAPQE